jgi:hypothetical protein
LAAEAHQQWKCCGRFGLVEIRTRNTGYFAETDNKLLREKYGDMRSIKTAEAILRLVAFAEKHKDIDNGKSGKQRRLENQGE